MKTLAERIRAARDNAGLSQVALASAIGITQQSVQYLENPAKNAQGSKHLAKIARTCGVTIEWLETGRGRMVALPQAEQPSAEYNFLTPEAQQVGAAWMKLSPEAQAWMRDLIFLLAASERNYPWLRRGRPRSETYDQYERRMEQNFAALKVLNSPAKR